LIDDIRARVQRIREYYERLEFNRAVQEIVAIADIGNKYFQDAAPWDVVKHDRQAAQAICTFAANCCSTVAALIKPVLPRYAADVETILRLAPLTFDDAARFDLQEHEGGPFQRLIERVAPKHVAAWLAASLESQPPTARQVAIEELAPQITYDEFAKLDLRVATVLQAEAVAGADKLLRLRVDIGPEQRTIFA